MGADTMVTRKNIEVVMPTYNGAQFVEDQINSIFNQTIRPSRLLVRDDCSTDRTLEILYSLKQFYHSWLDILPSNKNIGCKSSIDLLLSCTSAPYIALSDQDDFWLDTKLELCFADSCVEKIMVLILMLIHSDLKLVDTYLRDLHINYSSRQLLRTLELTLANLYYKYRDWLYYTHESSSPREVITNSITSTCS